MPWTGKIIEGASGFNEAMLTGESRPASKTVGATAIGGAINGANAVTIEVTATGNTTYLAQVIDLVKKAQATRSRTQDIANRAASWAHLHRSRRRLRYALRLVARSRRVA